MRFKGSRKTVALFAMIILLYFGGMMLNYILLSPIIYKGEEARILDEIGLYLEIMNKENGRSAYDKEYRDSLFSRYSVPYGGLLWVMDKDANVLYSNDSTQGNGVDILREKYGEQATNLLHREYAAPSATGIWVHDETTLTLMIASFYPETDLMYFFSLNFWLAYSKFIKVMQFLLLYMTVGGIIIFLASLLIFKRMAQQQKRETDEAKDLETAAVIQQSMLPSGNKHLLQLDVDARVESARKVAGDFYAYGLVDGLLYFCIGDVSGKGVPASLFMSKAITLLRVFASSSMKPTEMAASLNKELCINNSANMFMTGIVGTISPYDGTVRYINAGHEPPILWNGDYDSSPEFLNSTGNIPFGLFPETEYVEETFQMEKNGLIALYTDGVSEARNKLGNLMGRSCLLKFFDDNKNLSAKAINDRLLKTVHDYESGVAQSDDITLLTFRNIQNPKTIVLRNEISELRKIPAFLEEVFKECQLDSKQTTCIRTGLDEALTNCVYYAYDAPGHEIELTAALADRRLTFTIEDRGRAFNPLEYAPAPKKELEPGGLGISIYRSSFDDIWYNRNEEKNILKLTKNI